MEAEDKVIFQITENDIFTLALGEGMDVSQITPEFVERVASGVKSAYEHWDSVVIAAIGHARLEISGLS